MNRLQTLIRQNPILSFAVLASLAIHSILLMVRFAAPEAFRSPPANPGLEVVLVNAKHNSKPLNPEALAQANLDGGGNADAGRAKSPLPDMRAIEDGDSLKQATRHTEELETLQQKLMTQMQGTSHFMAPELTLKTTRTTAKTKGVDKVDSTAISRMAAEIARRIEDQNKRPKKTYITPSTQRVEYAMYYKTLQRKIEKVGTLNFPQRDGKKLYGELTISIPIFQDGNLYLSDGGPSIEQSSGNEALDKAALAIVRRSAPFGPFPSNMLLKNANSVWVVFSRFKFTREEALETQMYSQN